MNKLVYISLFLLLFVASSCGPMDETYQDFIKDGPKMYLTRINKDSLTIRNGWERIQIDYPLVTDGRSSKIILVLNGADTLQYDMQKQKRSSITLDNLNEGSIIFSTWLTDDSNSKSLKTDFVGTVYGPQFKSYLLNRTIASKSMNSGNLILKYALLLDSTLVASRFTWEKNGVETTEVRFYNDNGVDTLFNFSGNAFKMATLHVPEKNVLDSIWSEVKEYSK